MLRRSVALRGGSNVRVRKDYWEGVEAPPKYVSDRPSEQHMIEELSAGSAFGQWKRKMNTHRQQGLSYEPDEQGGTRGKQPQTGTGEDYSGYPYPLVYFGLFFFWFYCIHLQASTGCRAAYLVPDVDRKHPHIRYWKGPNPHLGDQVEPLATPEKNPITGNLCVIRPLPDLSHKAVGRGAQMAH